MFNEKPELKVVQVPITELKPSTYNPRHWDDKSVTSLTESIKRFGIVDPILVNGASNRKNIVIGGHFRLKVAKDMGFKEVPVVYLNIPDIEKEKELNLRLNKNTGAWDYEALKDFDLNLLMDVGFGDEDLSMIWDEQLEIEDDDFDTEKELEKIKETDIRRGDIFQLGNHRLICADSCDSSEIKKLVGDNRVSTLYCDPPYNINLDYDKGFGNKSKYGGNVDDNLEDDSYEFLLHRAINSGLSACQNDCHVFFYCDEKYIWLLQGLYGTFKIKNERVCLWIKNNQNATPQIAFNKMYEACVYGTVGKPYLSPRVKNLTEILNKEIGTGNKAIDDILDMLNIWMVKRLPGNSYEHPTEKPPTLHEKPLRRCTKPGDGVLDLFGGSGSTLIACEQLKRKCFISEINPIFCQLIINRYEKYANNKAKKLA